MCFIQNDAFYSVEEEETEKTECAFELSFKVTKTMRFDGGRRKRRKFCILILIFNYKFSREPNTKITEKMDFHPLQVSPLPGKYQDLQEYINVVPEENVAVEDHLENPNFQLHVLEIIKKKVEDAEENLKPFAICFLKIASRMGTTPSCGKSNKSFFSYFLLWSDQEQMEPKLGTCIRKILQSELQIPRGLKWPVQDVSSDVALLQPSQSTGAIPSSGSILQQPNGTCQDGGLQCLEELGAQYTGEEVMSSGAPKPDSPQPSGPPRLTPPRVGRMRNEPYPQPYSPRPNRKAPPSSGGAAGEGTSGSGTQGEGTGPTDPGTQEGGEGPPGSGPPGSAGEAEGPSNVPETPKGVCGCKYCCIM
ncbi:hypothetical protein AAG906_011814 [Vitis piasezkii]